MLRTPSMGFWRSSLCKKLQLLKTQATKVDNLPYSLETRPIEAKTTSPDGVVAILNAMLVELRSPSRWWTAGDSIPIFLQKLRRHVAGVFISPVEWADPRSFDSFPHFLQAILSLSTTLTGFWIKLASGRSTSSKLRRRCRRCFHNLRNGHQNRAWNVGNDHGSKVLRQ